MKDNIYIVAGNHKEYQDYIRNKNLDNIRYVYVNSVHTLLGLSEIKGFYIGTYLQRDDIEKIKQMIYIIKCKNEIIKKSEDYIYD